MKRIAYVTDIHLDEEFPEEMGIDTRRNWETILNDISSRGLTEIIVGGDIGEKETNKWFFESLRAYHIALTLGNHDYFDEVVKYYNASRNDGSTELYYSQEQEYHKYIFLDSSSEAISSKQLDWFKTELITTKPILLFVHHPILATGSQIDIQFSLEGREKLENELLNIKNEVTIFCGHYHCADERRKANVLQYITPASSYQVEQLPDEIKVNKDGFGYRIIELNKMEISTEVVMFA